MISGVVDCESDPCQNGGTCTQNTNTFICKCPILFDGKSCQTSN